MQTDPRKLLAVQQYPIPKDVKSLRSFLGLYKRFMPGFSKVAGPLHALTKKDVDFVWVSGGICHVAAAAFILENDTSGSGLGAVLAQEQPEGTIARSLQKHEQNYGITELEGLCVAVKHFRPSLVPRLFRGERKRARYTLYAHARN